MHCDHSTSLAASLTRWLTPQVWKQAHQHHAPKKTSRWDLHPLLTVLLLMTWTSGDSEAERFVTARACYVAAHQHDKRPGKTLQGFQQALGKLPLPVLATTRSVYVPADVALNVTVCGRTGAVAEAS